MAKWFCTTCRSYLGKQLACSPDHTAIDLERDDHRRHLAQLVWRLRGAAAARVTRYLFFAVMLGLLFAMMGLTSEGADIAMLVMVLPVALFLIVVPSAARFIASLRVHTVCGAEAEPPKPHGEPSFVGIVRATASTTAPLTGRSCAGFAIELTASDCHVGPVLARLGHTEGLELVAEDGATVHLPRGTLRLLGGTPENPTQPPTRVLDIFGGAAATLCPADGGEERVISQGDRLELFGALEPVQVGGGYRDGVWSKQPTGLPVLRVAKP